MIYLWMFSFSPRSSQSLTEFFLPYVMSFRGALATKNLECIHMYASTNASRDPSLHYVPLWMTLGEAKSSPSRGPTRKERRLRRLPIYRHQGVSLASIMRGSYNSIKGKTPAFFSSSYKNKRPPCVHRGGTLTCTSPSACTKYDEKLCTYPLFKYGA